jgi:hypothetical protein
VATLLFFDDWYLHRRENVGRHVGRPALVPEGTLEDPYVDPAWGYPTVVRLPEAGCWRCLYQGQLPDGRFVPVVAESDDGIHWRLPDLTRWVPLRERLTPHQLFGPDRFGEWSGPYVDPQATGTDRWLKGLVVHRAPPGPGPPSAGGLQSLLVTSPDGLHWQYAADVDGAAGAPAQPWHPSGADPPATAFWNPYRGAHVLTLRPALNDRRIALRETRDWRTFSPLELALQADALDSPCAELYGMPVIPYEHLFVGLLWLYHTDPLVDAEHKYRLGKIDCQLAYSHNGWHFQRTVREPFLANGEPGTHGAGCIYPSSLVPVADELRLYSSAAKGEHGQIRRNPASRQGAILLHRLRRDGFVFLAPDGGAGEVATRPLQWASGEPQLNAAAPHGEVRVQVLDARGEPLEGYRFDDCIPFRGDSTHWTPEWRDGRLLAALRDRIVRLAVRLINGRLYAIRGDFEVKTAHEARLFAEHGVRTPPRPGF